VRAAVAGEAGVGSARGAVSGRRRGGKGSGGAEADKTDAAGVVCGGVGAGGTVAELGDRGGGDGGAQYRGVCGGDGGGSAGVGRSAGGGSGARAADAAGRAWSDVECAARGGRGSRAGGRRSMDCGGERSGADGSVGTRGERGGVARAVAGARGGRAAAGDLACVPFGDDGRGAGRVPRSIAAGGVEGAAQEVSVECKWDVDPGGRSAGRELLGKASAGDGAVWGQRERVDGRWGAGVAGGGPWERARGAGAAARGARGVWEFAWGAGVGVGSGTDGEEFGAAVGGRGQGRLERILPGRAAASGGVANLPV